MDRETLFQYFEQNYISKSAVLPWLPLGMNPDVIWEELQKRRKAKCTMLPIHGSGGEPCWYVTTDRMIAASEQVVEVFMSYQPSLEPTVLAPPEENFYTSFLEGMEMNPDEAAQFILGNGQPNGPEEQLLHNNRYGLAFAEMNLFHPLDSRFIRTLAEIVTANMEEGGGQYRDTDRLRIESMQNEPYTIPPARAIPDYVGEISAYLADPGVHPMIKAGVVQAWTLMVRPFPAGNERLARLLSLVVLHRAGYGFFSDVSLSSLIATNGYAYYEAVNSLLRRENGGDMTYFLDYFLQLLAHAAAEHNRKAEEKTTETLAAERQMAGTVLAPAYEEEEIPEMDISEFTFLGSGDPYSEEKTEVLVPVESAGFLEDTEKEETWRRKGGEWVGKTMIQEKLSVLSNVRSLDYKAILLKYLASGKYVFSSKELVEDLGKNSGTVTGYMRKLSELKILQIIKEKPGVPMLYCFYPGDNQFSEADYSEELLTLLSYLANNHRSARDSRIGKAILQSINQGYVLKETYANNNEEDKWPSDMEFAEQIGLVNKIDDDCFFILKQIDHRFDLLNEMQRKRATELYNSFGSNFFSQKMVVAELSYSENVTKAILHTFRLLRILDCRKDGINMYQFLVNPEENPECFWPAA